MSVQTLYTAATGMEALQQKLDVIANNLANVNTTGFKRDRCNFEDLFYRTEVVPGHPGCRRQLHAASAFKPGWARRCKARKPTRRKARSSRPTSRSTWRFKAAVILQVTDPTGQILYTRAGNLSVNANGQLVVGDATVGRLLDPAISIPPTATSISIGTDGTVSVARAGSTTMQQVGAIQLAKFINPQGLVGARRQSVQPDRRLRRADARTCPAPTASARSSRVRWKPRTSSRSTN